MIYLQTQSIFKRTLSVLISVMMMFSMFSMLTSVSVSAALLATANGKTEITVSWDAETGVSGYYIFRSTSENGAYEKIATVPQTSYTDENLNPDTTYYYKVQSYTEGTTQTLNIFTIRAERYGAPTDGMYTYENSAGEVRFKTYATVPSSTNNPEAYWYISNGYLCNYSTGRYVGMGTTTVPSIGGSGTYATDPMNAYTSATVVNDANFKWTIESITCTSGSNQETDKTANVIHLTSNAAKQWAHGRQKTNDGLVAVSTVSTTFTGSCGRHWKVENTAAIQATPPAATGNLSDAVSATTEPLIAVPTEVIADTVDSSSIRLTWTAVSGATGYTIYRSPDDDVYTNVGTSTTPTYTDTELSQNSRYFYKITATDGINISALSSAIYGDTSEIIPQLSITEYSSSNVNLSWTYGGDDNPQFRVYRSIDGVSYSAIATVDTTTYSDTTVETGNTYYYKVSTYRFENQTGVVGGMDYSSRINEESFRQDTLQSDGLYNAGYIGPDSWAGYTVDIPAAGEYTMVFYQAAPNADTHNPTLRSGSAAGTILATATFTGQSNWQTYTQSTQTVNLPAGTQELFYVADAELNLWKMEITGNVESTGTLSDPVSQTVSDYPAPTNVVASANGYNEMDLSWDEIADATEYTVYRSTSENGVYQNVGNTAVNSFSDTGLICGTEYYYYVTATNGTDTSGSSLKANASTVAFVTVTPQIGDETTKSLTVSWTNATGVTQYSIYRSESENDGYSLIQANATSPFTDTSLADGQTYYYKIQTTDGANTALSSTVSSTTLQLNVPDAYVSAATVSTVTLTWNAVDGANSYIVYRSLTENGTYNIMGEYILSTSFTDIGLAEGQTYYYKVAATDEFNTSQSAPITATTDIRPFLGDKYNRENVFDVDVVSSITNITAGGASIIDGALALSDSATINAFLSEGFEINPASNYDYLVFKIKGAKGNEQSRISLTDEYEYTNANRTAFSSMKSSNGENVPAITTEWQYVVIDIAESGLSYEVDAVNNTKNFSFTLHLDQSSENDTIYIDEVFLTNDVILPSELNAVNNGSDEINLSWTAPTDSATLYSIYRSKNQTDYTKIASNIVETSFTDTGLTQNTNYSYYVTAQYNLTETAPSNIASALTDAIDAPYLIVQSINNNSVVAGESFTAEAIIKNTGLLAQDESYSVTFTMGESTQTVTVTDDLAMNGEKVVTAVLTAPVGVSSAMLDVSLSTGEADSKLVAVTSPSLSIRSVSNADATANAGNYFTVVAVVENTGTAEQTATFEVVFRFNNGTEDVVTVENDLAPGSDFEVRKDYLSPMINGDYTASAKIGSQEYVNGTITVVGGDDVEPYTDPAPDPITVPDYTVDYATYVAGPFVIRNNYVGFGYQYLYDSMTNNSYTGAEDANNGSDSTAYANYGRVIRNVAATDILASALTNEEYMWNIYSYTIGTNTYYMLRNVATGRYMHTGAYTDYYSYNNDNNSVNTFAWNNANVSGATGIDGTSNPNRELSYYMFNFKVDAAEGVAASTQANAEINPAGFTAQIMNQRYAWGQRVLHGEFSNDHNTTERATRVFFTSNTYGWGTKTFLFTPASVEAEAANLTVTQATTNISRLMIGSSFDTDITITNNGNSDAVGTVENPIKVKIGFNGVYNVYNYVGTIAAGDNAVITQTITPNKVAAEGANVQITVNPDWMIGETDYTDNNYTVEDIIVTSTDVPFLEVSSVENVTADYNQVFTATAVITNSGRADRTEDYVVSFNFNGETKDITITDDLAAGATKTVTTTFTAPPDGGEYDINVSAQAGTRTGKLTVNAPEITLLEVLVPQTPINAGESYQISAVIKNTGLATFVNDESTVIEFMVNGERITEIINQNLAVSEEATITASFMAPPVNDDYTVTITSPDDTDDAQKITVVNGDDKDTDPTSAPLPTADRTYYMIRSVQRGAYLLDNSTTEGLTLADTAYRVYWDTAVTATAAADSRYLWTMEDSPTGYKYIKNVATGRYIQAHDGRYYGYDGNYNKNGVALVDTPVESMAGMTLTSVGTGTRDGYNTTTYTMHDTFAFGQWAYYLNTEYIGAGNFVTISTQNNNNTRNFEFLEMPISSADITVTDVETDASSVYYNYQGNGTYQSFNATATIKNIGGTAVEEGTPIKVKFAFNGRITTVLYTEGLDVGASQTINAEITPNKLTDNSTLTVTANSDYAVNEKDYENNQATVQDLAVTEYDKFANLSASLTLSKGTIGKNENAVVTVTVLNAEGTDATTQEYSATLFLDGEAYSTDVNIDSISAGATKDFVFEIPYNLLSTGNHSVYAAVSYQGTESNTEDNTSASEIFKKSSFDIVVEQRTSAYTAFRQFMDVYAVCNNPTDIQMVRFEGKYENYEELTEAFADEYAGNQNSFLANDNWTATGTVNELFDAYRNYDILNVLNRTWTSPAKEKPVNEDIYTECGYFSAIDETNQTGEVWYTLLAYDPDTGDYLVRPVEAINFDYTAPSLQAVVVNDANLGSLLHITATTGESGVRKVSYQKGWGGNDYSFDTVIGDYNTDIALDYTTNGLSQTVLGYDLNENADEFEAYIPIDTDSLKNPYYAVGVISGTLHSNINVKVTSGIKMSMSLYTNISSTAHSTFGETVRYAFIKFNVSYGVCASRQIFDATDMTTAERNAITVDSDCWQTAPSCNVGYYKITKNGYYIIKTTDSEGTSSIYVFNLTKTGTEGAALSESNYKTDSLTVDGTAPVFYTSPTIYTDAETNQKYAEIYLYDVGGLKCISYSYNTIVPMSVYSNMAFADANSRLTVTEGNGAIVESASTDGVLNLNDNTISYANLDSQRIRIPLVAGQNIMISAIDYGNNLTRYNIPVLQKKDFSAYFEKVNYLSEHTDANGKTWYTGVLLMFKYRNANAVTKQVINATDLTEQERTAILDGTNSAIWSTDSAVSIDKTFYYANKNEFVIFKVTAADGREYIFSEDINYIDVVPTISEPNYSIVNGEFFATFTLETNTELKSASLSQVMGGPYQNIPNAVFYAGETAVVTVADMYAEGNEIIAFEEDEDGQLLNRYNIETEKFETTFTVKVNPNKFLNLSCVSSMNRYSNITISKADIALAYQQALN